MKIQSKAVLFLENCGTSKVMPWHHALKCQISDFVFSGLILF